MSNAREQGDDNKEHDTKANAANKPKCWVDANPGIESPKRKYQA
ncbi:hypothetical protein RESH_04117 [Rhodopirellula europaea SH398]|uniref:Uncharacterized protein n=1 Tax=Rhodopirellula europaea SH398 TaxID=1263868 RepID=M5SCB1_9BACT|nr:hypothetical protein RESH_04117 [Rhodopirellula europaea SH398]